MYSAFVKAQMDSVSAGALINAVVVDVVDVRDVQVAIPVNAAVAIGILGAAGAAAFQQPGCQMQERYSVEESRPTAIRERLSFVITFVFGLRHLPSASLTSFCLNAALTLPASNNRT